MFHSYKPQKTSENRDFLLFSGGIEVERCLKMGEINKNGF